MYQPQLSENPRQRIGADHGRCAADTEPATMRSGERSKFLKRGVMLAQDRVSALQQFLARLCQDDAARRSYEKLRSRLSLQLPDLHANRRLRYVDAYGPRRESSALRDRYKCLQLSDVHILPRINVDYYVDKIF